MRYVSIRPRQEDWETEANLNKIEEWGKLGLSMGDIASNIGIHRGTLYRWKDKSSDICNALSKGNEATVEILENALMKRAVGYDIEETTYRYDDEGNKIKQRGQTKHIYPDVTALKFALINKSKGKWKDKVEYTDTEANDKLDNLIAKFEQQAKEK